MKNQSFGITAVVTVAAILILIASGSPSFAQAGSIFATDLTLRETTTMSGPMMGGAKPQTSTKYFSGNAIRDNSSEGYDTILRFDSGKAIFIDHKKKTYSEITFTEMQQMLDKAMAAMGQNKEAMEAMKQMMGGMVGEIKVTKQGAGESIAGYSTEKFLVTIPPMTIEVWSAPDLKVPPSFYDALKLRTPANPMFDTRKMYDEYKKISGMTMKSVSTMKMMNMTMTTTTTVTAVEKGPIPASTFEIPAGYKSTPYKIQ